MEITVYTQNVWFSPNYREGRTYALINFILKHKPDFVCLQEITPSVRDIIISNQKILQVYTWKDDSIGNYGVAILSKSPIDNVIILPLVSKMNRKFLGISVNNQVIISTVHLESLDNEDIRRTQLKKILSQMNKYPVTILTGDFNMKSSENFLLTIDYTMYSEFLTYNGQSNKMVNSSKYPPQPFDRFLIKGCQIKSIEMVNDKPFKNNIYISDHYGLFATIII